MSRYSGPYLICLTGPESTGKTTLAEALATRLGAITVPEAARTHAERVNRSLTFQDVADITAEHVRTADRAISVTRSRECPYVILDTDLVSTFVYSRHYYGAVPPGLEHAMRERLADLYVLCDIDVPWTPDGIRDQPGERMAMLNDFRTTLADLAAPAVHVTGDVESRLRQVIEALPPAST